MTDSSRQPRKLGKSCELRQFRKPGKSPKLRKSCKLRSRMIATGLFAVTVLVSLVASQCSSSEDSLDEVVSPTTVAETTTSTTARVDPTTTTRVEATTTTEVEATTTTEADSTPPPETSPPVADTGDPENAEPEEQVEEQEEQVAVPEEQIEETEEQEEPDSTVSTTTMPRSSDASASQTSRVSLSSFDECDALLDYIRSEALERVGPYGFEDDDDIIGPFFAEEEAIFEDEALASAAPSAPPAIPGFSDGPPAEGRTSSTLTQGEDFSGTNVQVEGVDEADIVKTDGRRIIGVGSSRSGNNEIWIADITNPIPKLQGRLLLSDGSYSELYLAGDRVFVIGTSTVGIDPPGGGGTFENEQADSSDATDDEEIMADDIAASRIAPRRYANAVVITEVDISDPENPEVMRHLRVEGSYVSSRAASGYARVVISSPPESLGFVRPSYDSASSEASAERFNKLIVQESTLEQWLPNYNLHSANGRSINRGRLLDCDRVFAPSEFSGFDQVSVLSFATGESLELRDAVSTMASGETVYASPSNLYVSRVVHDYDPDSNRRKAVTVVHKFSLDSSGSADYEASGAAVGSPINQYAFHEYDGRLFVATTSGRSDSESFVTVLEDDGGALKQVGQVGNLGRNEDIYAVRYIADKAYVVTFRRTDPLYVIDLSDPTNPTTEGELKITGYSAYLHPVGDNLLLGVGREATTTGLVTGVKFSLFDLSEPANPRVLDTLALEDTLGLEGALLLGDSHSRVEWDAKAFLWWKSLNLAIVPVNIPSKNFYGASVLFVDTTADSPKIELISHISQYSPARQLKGNPEGCQWYRVPTSSLNWISAIYWGMHVVISDTTVVKVCSNSSGVSTINNGVPDDHICQSVSRRPGEVEEYRSRISIAEIVEEISAATNDSSSGDLRDLLARLQNSSVKHSKQVSICFSLIQFDLARQREILRSIVITDDLWTLSRGYLQANDLDTLARRAWLDIPG